MKRVTRFDFVKALIVNIFHQVNNAHSILPLTQTIAHKLKFFKNTKTIGRDCAKIVRVAVTLKVTATLETERLFDQTDHIKPYRAAGFAESEFNHHFGKRPRRSERQDRLLRKSIGAIWAGNGLG